MKRHPALTMVAVWGLCAAAFFILPFELLDRPLTEHGFLVLGSFMGAYLLGTALVPASRTGTAGSGVPNSRIDACRAERCLMWAAAAATLFLLMDLQDKNPFDLAAASDLRSESADALLKGESSLSSAWFQIAFLLYPASYVFMATHIVYSERIALWRVGLFGFLPVVLATASMGGRMPIFYAVLVAGLAWQERSKLADPQSSRHHRVTPDRALANRRAVASPSSVSSPNSTADEAEVLAGLEAQGASTAAGSSSEDRRRTGVALAEQGWFARIQAILDGVLPSRHLPTVRPLASPPARRSIVLSTMYRGGAFPRGSSPSSTRWVVKLLWPAFLAALLYYFVAVFSTRAAVVGGAAEMFSVAESLWGVGFRGPSSDLIFSFLGDELAYLVFIFSWYVVQGVVMCNYLFTSYDGPLQLGVYGVDLMSAVMRRLDPQGVSDGFDSLLTLGTYGFFPSAWGSLYVDFGYFALLLCVVWGAFAGFCYKRVVRERRQDWLIVGPFVTIGVLCSTINTPLGFTNGFVTHAWLLAAFLLLRRTRAGAASRGVVRRAG
ncbi:hypothetical protein [Accumulibacter sp.]|uniref:hypothetical protein n=1 Tax=Accumulibacter sp. TaxID=2053492 RepID=UPI00260265A0|nr:hypothetical protein [Accumulibacter sp.]